MKNLIKERRKELGVTQTELADSVLSTRQTIYLIEQNKVMPSLELAFKLANYFDTSIEELFLYEKKGPAKDDAFFIFEK